MLGCLPRSVCLGSTAHTLHIWQKKEGKPGDALAAAASPQAAVHETCNSAAGRTGVIKCTAASFPRHLWCRPSLWAGRWLLWPWQLRRSWPDVDCSAAFRGAAEAWSSCQAGNLRSWRCQHPAGSHAAHPHPPCFPNFQAASSPTRQLETMPASLSKHARSAEN